MLPRLGRGAPWSVFDLGRHLITDPRRGLGHVELDGGIQGLGERRRAEDLAWRRLETELWGDRGDAHLQGVVTQTGLRPGHIGVDRGLEIPHRKLGKAIAVLADGRLSCGEIGIVGIQDVLRPFLPAGGVFLQDALLRCLGLRPFRRGALHGRIGVGLGLFCFPHLPLELMLAVLVRLFSVTFPPLPFSVPTPEPTALLKQSLMTGQCTIAASPMTVDAGDIGATTPLPRVVGILLDPAAIDQPDEGPAEIRLRLPIKEEGRDDQTWVIG